MIQDSTYSAHITKPFFLNLDQVASTLPLTANLEHYLPTYPPKGNFRKKNVQLKLYDSSEARTVLDLYSYLRIDGIEEVPLEVLSEATRPDGLGLMLLEKSFSTLQHLLRLQT